MAVPHTIGWDAGIPNKSFRLYLLLVQHADAETGEGSVTCPQIAEWLQLRGKHCAARVPRWLHPLIVHQYLAFRGFEGQVIRYRVRRGTFELPPDRDRRLG